MKTTKEDSVSWAKSMILNHAYARISEHTDIGGSDLEIVQDTIDEIFELCAEASTGKIHHAEKLKKFK